MKICVIVPSAEYLQQAGVRIRYRRIQPHLAALGHELVLEEIDRFRGAATIAADAYLFSKCYDARAILLARLIRSEGRLVGADFFDDMFSHEGDSRFVRHRAWLREIGGLLDYGLASTPRMRTIVEAIVPGVPVHVLNDPFDSFDAQGLAAAIERKRAQAEATRTLPIAWFGVGDNPHFTVGLSDLAAFGDDLHRLAARGFSPRLSILTNRRALTDDGLRMIARLGVPYEIEEWTAPLEAELLRSNLVSFLPVNGQNFSIAKSLNRAVSALTGGTQVLSSGFPLYDPLSAFLYRDPDGLADDIDAATLRLRGETMADLAALFHVWGDPELEVEKLAGFLTALPAQEPRESRPLAVLHGRRSPVSIHKQALKLRQLSVGTPYSPPNLGYDARIAPAENGGYLRVALSAHAQALLPDALREHSAVDAKGDHAMVLNAPPAMIDRLTAAKPGTLASAFPEYGHVVRDVSEVIARLFPQADRLLSEMEAPLDAPLDQASGEDAIRIVEARMIERVLFVANANVPSLQISFLKPLQGYADQGRLNIMTITDEDLKVQFGKQLNALACRQWVSGEVKRFQPTLIIFCRYSGPLWEVYRNHAQKNAVPMIFHVDDDLLNIPAEIGQAKYEYHNNPARLQTIRTLMSAADLIYASTEELRVRVERTGLARDLVAGRIYCAAEVRRTPVPRKVRKFGYMGGGDHAHDLETILPAIVSVLDRWPEVKFEIFGAIPLPQELERFGERVEVIPPILIYAEFLARFAEMDWDIGICPLAPSDFNRAKANTKWIEYTAVGIAVVATRGMAYDDCCSGGAGLLAGSIEEWTAALDRLIGEDGACYAQTMVAQAKMAEQFSIPALQQQIFDIVDRVTARRLVAPFVTA